MHLLFTEDRQHTHGVLLGKLAWVWGGGDFEAGFILWLSNHTRDSGCFYVFRAHVSWQQQDSGEGFPPCV